MCMEVVSYNISTVGYYEIACVSTTEIPGRTYLNATNKLLIMKEYVFEGEAHFFSQI